LRVATGAWQSMPKPWWLANSSLVRALLPVQQMLDSALCLCQFFVLLSRIHRQNHCGAAFTTLRVRSQEKKKESLDPFKLKIISLLTQKYGLSINYITACVKGERKNQIAVKHKVT